MAFGLNIQKERKSEGQEGRQEGSWESRQAIYLPFKRQYSNPKENYKSEKCWMLGQASGDYILEEGDLHYDL